MSIEHPSAACPKCGDVFGFLYAKPRHNRTRVTRPGIEWLEWPCVTCGYRIRTATADAIVPGPVGA